MAKWAALVTLSRWLCWSAAGCAAASGADRKSIGTDEQVVRAIDDRSRRESLDAVAESLATRRAGMVCREARHGLRGTDAGKSHGGPRLPTSFMPETRIVVEQNTAVVDASLRPLR